MVDKGYYSADSALHRLGPGRPMDLLYLFPLEVNNYFFLKRLLVYGKTMKESKEERQKLLVTVVKIAMDFITSIRKVKRCEHQLEEAIGAYPKMYAEKKLRKKR